MIIIDNSTSRFKSHLNSIVEMEYCQHISIPLPLKSINKMDRDVHKINEPKKHYSVVVYHLSKV